MAENGSSNGDSNGNGTQDHGDIETYMFNPILLEKINFKNNHVANFKDNKSPQNVGSHLKMRPLKKSDYSRGYINLLRQLTKCGDISQDMWEHQFDKMLSCPNTYYIAVIYDEAKDQIIGSATLHVEWKFIHACQHRGRIEDVVVNSDYRGQQLGKLLVETMTLLGKYLGCYKLSLDCENMKIPFYAQFGYVEEEDQHFMLIRVKD